MSTEIRVPEIGESISSGILAAWLRTNGDVVTEGEEIFELETDKATLAVPSPASGTLALAAQEGDEVAVGQVVGTIEETAGVAAVKESEAGDQPLGDGQSDEPAAPQEPLLSPAVRRIAEEHGLDATTLVGTGPGGRITKADALAAVPTAPATEKQTQPEPAAPAGESGNAQRRVPMSGLRRRIAENLVLSRQSSAHVTTFNEIDMSTVLSMRATYKDGFEKRYGVRLGFMSFFLKASQIALEQFPEANAFLDGPDIVYNQSVNIGVALSSERGLLTPVIKDVASKSFADIELAIVDFIDRANAKRLKPDEMTGATFTVSNGGVFGSLLSTPIPSPPQTAVLGMHAIEKRPVVVHDEIVVRPMMYVALTYDHRMIDGREAVGLLGKIKRFIEDPASSVLGL